jgi:hypothetical protein
MKGEGELSHAVFTHGIRIVIEPQSPRVAPVDHSFPDIIRIGGLVKLEHDRYVIETNHRNLPLAVRHGESGTFCKPGTLLFRQFIDGEGLLHRHHKVAFQATSLRFIRWMESTKKNAAITAIQRRLTGKSGV